VQKFKFGTDGWRGVISDDFTFKNVRIVAQAIANYLLTKGKMSDKLEVVVGYDNRFLAERFAEIIAETLAFSGIKAYLSEKSCPSQTVSFTVKKKRLSGGVMVTASHNPPQFCGIKFKAPYGGSATEEITKEIEKNLYKPLPARRPTPNDVVGEDITSPYLRRLKSLIDLELIKDKRLRIIAEPMFGVANGYLAEVLKETKCRVITLHNYRDVLFGGLNPEPIEKNLRELKERVKKERADVGLATDGDADRIGVVDERGDYLPPHQVFPLLLLYLVKEKGWRGKVVQTISLGYLSERIAKKFNLEWKEVPIGFKYVADVMLKERVIIGGEESGGYGYQGYIPERDGILSSLFFVEMLAKTKKKLSTLGREMESEFGKSYFLRKDYRIEDIKIGSKKRFVEKLLSSAPRELLGIKVKKIKAYDGIEYILEDDSWLLLRPSGTEPILRTYAESNNFKKTEKLLKIGREIVYRA